MGNQSASQVQRVKVQLTLRRRDERSLSCRIQSTRKNLVRTCLYNSANGLVVRDVVVKRDAGALSTGESVGGPGNGEIVVSGDFEMVDSRLRRTLAAVHDVTCFWGRKGGVVSCVRESNLTL